MALWGDHEQGFHVTQLACYALTVLALGGLLIRFGMPRDLAWLATLLWAIHALHVESVAWLSERKGVLASVFVLACGHAWIRYRRGGGPGWIAIATAAAVAGTWSKAPAMFAPACSRRGISRGASRLAQRGPRRRRSAMAEITEGRRRPRGAR